MIVIVSPLDSLVPLQLLKLLDSKSSSKAALDVGSVGSGVEVFVGDVVGVEAEPAFTRSETSNGLLLLLAYSYRNTPL